MDRKPVVVENQACTSRFAFAESIPVQLGSKPPVLSAHHLDAAKPSLDVPALVNGECTRRSGPLHP
jgi:hypothetical protein